MKTIKKILFILVIVFLLTACGSKTESLQVTDPAKPIQANIGEDFQIVIESNPTTGYHWEVVGELNAVDFINKDYKSTSDPNLVGGGGVDVWTFKAMSAGEINITLGYYPPSNTPTDPQQTTTFTVIVK